MMGTECSMVLWLFIYIYVYVCMINVFFGRFKLVLYLENIDIK